LAKRRLLEDLDLDDDPKATSERDAYETQVRLWQTPKHEFVDIPGAVQLAIFLPSLMKLAVRVSEDKKGICVVAERQPLAPREGEPGKTPEVKMHIKLEAGVVRREKLKYDYHSDWGIAFVYIEDSELGSLNTIPKQGFAKTLKSRIESAFSAVRRNSKML